MNERSGMTCLSEHGDFVCRLGKGHEGGHRSGLVTWPTTTHIESLAAAYPDYDDVGPDDEYRGQ